MITKIADRSIVGGLAGFTRLGFKLRSHWWEESRAPMSGRTVVITGATSGIGEAAAASLAARGARVVLVARNSERAHKTARDIVESTGNEQVAIQIADLSETGEVRELANRLLVTEPGIHVLINNAGAMFSERAESSEGIELTLATNLLSGFLLTNLLLERLQQSAPARIINVSSGGMYTQGISLRNLQWTEGDYDGTRAYARTKRGQVILTEMWADLLAGTGVTANAMHPGWADTPGLEGSLPGFRKWIKPLLRTADEGADTVDWLAAAPEMTWQSGGFFLDRQPHVTNVLPGTDLDADERIEFWKQLSALAGWHGSGPS